MKDVFLNKMQMMPKVRISIARFVTEPQTYLKMSKTDKKSETAGVKRKR